VAKTAKENTKRNTGPVDTQEKPVIDFGVGIGWFLGKLGGLVEKLGELAEKGEELSRSGEVEGLGRSGNLRGVYGFSVRSGLGEQGQREFKVEPFGNIRKTPAGETVVEQLREPMVDVHEESEHVLVLAEIPGVSKKDVQLALCGDRLTISAQRGQTNYRKEVELPERFSEDKMSWDCKNGILKIRLERSSDN
jgi:HSP20 family protein